MHGMDGVCNRQVKFVLGRGKLGREGTGGGGGWVGNTWVVLTSWFTCTGVRGLIQFGALPTMINYHRHPYKWYMDNTYIGTNRNVTKRGGTRRIYIIKLIGQKNYLHHKTFNLNLQ
jgi:hypothetical protein